MICAKAIDLGSRLRDWGAKQRSIGQLDTRWGFWGEEELRDENLASEFVN